MSLTGTTLIVVTLAACSGEVAGEQMPPGMPHQQHREQMRKDKAMQHRGAAVMGFDQMVTSHHFRLASSGGAIEVTVKDQADEANRQLIRAHLQDIANQFAAGEFEKPLRIHGESPDGVSEMMKRRSAIAYTFEALPDGGRIRIETGDRNALDAVHRYLRYQIREHKTGDSLKVSK